MKVINKKKTMFTVQNLMKIFLAVLFATAALALCTTDVEAGHKKGTRVDVGAHADLGGGGLSLLVMYVNPSNNPITIEEIKIFKPDGTLDSPVFNPLLFPEPPFDLEPFESRGFLLGNNGINPVTFPPMGFFQVHTNWKSQQGTAGLKSWSVIIRSTQFGEEVGRTSQEGFNLSDRSDRDD
jgi:hypothetical protein